MFEMSAEELRAFGHATLHPDLTPGSETEWHALVDRLIAADPDPWPDLSAAEVAARDAAVIARGETEPMSAELAARLWAIDPTSLDRDRRIGLSKPHDRVINAFSAKRAEAIAATVEVTPAADEWVSAEQAAAGDLGAALHVGSGAAGSLVADSVTVCGRLPDTFAAARSGDLSWTKAVTLADAVAPLTDQQTRLVEARVLPRAAARTPAQHRAAVRRAVDTIDPDGAEERRRKMREEVRLARQHLGSGMGELYGRMTSEQLETIWAGADHWARRAKAAGDDRTLDQLRVAALVSWASSFLTHGDPTYCDTTCTPVGEETDAPGEATGTEPMDAEPTDTEPVTEPSADLEPAATAPTRHGRPAVIAVEWDLTSLLGLTDHCGRLTTSGAMLPPAAVRDLLAGGVRIRRLVIDPTNGELVDLTPRTWLLPPADGAAHPQPVELRLIVDGPPGSSDDDTLLADYDVYTHLSADVHAALHALDPRLAALITDVLHAPLTALSLDGHPDADTPSAALAGFINTRDAHPVNPCAGMSDAAAGDIDHNQPRSQGGKTTRRNTASFARRWHLLKTHAGWTVQRINRAWRWTSPTGRHYTVEPHDYRLGP